MLRLCLVFLAATVFLALTSADLYAKEGKPQNPKVLLKTSMGNIKLELYPDKAPKSVENFLTYVKEGFYNGVIFHRVIKDFMIQTGGFDKDMLKKKTRPPIVNEDKNGLKNNRGTISYARTGVVNSATSQFFINHKDNHFLDHKNDTARGYGYAVFGKVIEGMDVVDKIASVKTGIKKGMKDVPLETVQIISATVVKKDATKAKGK